MKALMKAFHGFQHIAGLPKLSAQPDILCYAFLCASLQSQGQL